MTLKGTGKDDNETGLLDEDEWGTRALTEDSEHLDEIEEVRNKSKKETFIIKLWRITLVVLLSAVGVSVTVTTYKLLRKEETNNFETAYAQFSRTVADAAIKQQEDSRDAFRGFASTVSAYVQSSSNMSWPFVSIPLYEVYARHVLIHSGTEVFSFFPLVKRDLVDSWIQFANVTHEEMVEEAHMLKSGNLDQFTPVGYHPFISRPDPVNGGFAPDKERDFYFPSWHFSPPAFTYGLINWNLMTVPDYENCTHALLSLKNESVVSRVRKYISVGVALSPEEHDAMHSKLPDSTAEHPHSFMFHPIHEIANDDTSPVVGILGTGLAWDASLLNLLPAGVVGLEAIIKNDCDQEYTYEINGPEAIFMGEGDKHDPQYDEYEVVVNLAPHTHPNFTTTPGHCQFTMHIYPTSSFEDNYHSNVPIIYAVVVAITFILVTIVFFIYNVFVNRRNEKMVQNAAKSNAVISALFPKNIRDRIMEDDKAGNFYNKKKNSKKSKRIGDSRPEPRPSMSRPPLADYFPETTVLFADISGFTAWSSVREPPQVFTLLETLYGAFDKIAKQARVFKVETVGDCYVAATGIPQFHKEHAVYMVRFARQILKEMTTITNRLEISLGPDTGDLSLRIGMHSGPVTAGVLRGEKARFQLFGDTMNTASRIENTGEAGRIHLSRETAESLKSCGKSHWLVKRDEPVKIKGKGDIQTYWIGVKYDHKDSAVSTKGLESSEKDSGDNNTDHTDSSSVQMQEPLVEGGSDITGREARLVDWNVQIFMDFLRQIVARRNAARGMAPRSSTLMGAAPRNSAHRESVVGLTMEEDYCPLEEVREVIRLPAFDSKVARLQEDHHTVKIPDEVEQQFREYVTIIASLYRANDFHNFEHASHVTMSVIKLLSRIVAPTDLGEDVDLGPETSLRAQLHDHTYGITSDPLTQFACAFSALIHDVDHEGVPNAQLVKEKAGIAARYKERSVAEQNSMVLAWNLLMESRFNELRSCLCETPNELRRFRNLVINGVMATDITDKELKNLRNARWDKAFKDYSTCSFGSDDDEKDIRDVIHRKATIVIEHLLQASDVAHTMQHWHVYRKWNERFFRECYAAYKAGRAEKDPSEGWYHGEIGFFDFYIIPLAKKLDTCGVFGKSSDEYLNYALQNREEWKTRGEEVVAEMLAAVQKEYGHAGDS